MKKLQITFSLFAIVALLALPATAFAASGEEGYGGPNNVVSGVDTGNDEGTPPTAPEETETAGVSSESSSDDSDVLPFTGTDLLILAASGALLIAFGFGLRRLTRRPSQP